MEIVVIVIDESMKNELKIPKKRDFNYKIG
jgi:hypothetical protein